MIRLLLPKQRNPYPTIDVIIEKEDSIILIKRGRDPNKGKISIPGGFVEWGETVEQAAVREVEEETGLKVRLKEILGVYSDPNRDSRGHIMTVTFVADPVEGEPRGGSDTADAKWFKLDEIPFNDIPGDHPKILHDYIKWKNEKGTYWSTK